MLALQFFNQRLRRVWNLNILAHSLHLPLSRSAFIFARSPLSARNFKHISSVLIRCASACGQEVFFYLFFLLLQLKHNAVHTPAQFCRVKSNYRGCWVHTSYCKQMQIHFHFRQAPRLWAHWTLSVFPVCSELGPSSSCVGIRTEGRLLLNPICENHHRRSFNAPLHLISR